MIQFLYSSVLSGPPPSLSVSYTSATLCPLLNTICIQSEVLRTGETLCLSDFCHAFNPASTSLPRFCPPPEHPVSPLFPFDRTLFLLSSSTPTSVHARVPVPLQPPSSTPRPCSSQPSYTHQRARVVLPDRALCLLHFCYSLLRVNKPLLLLFLSLLFSSPPPLLSLSRSPSPHFLLLIQSRQVCADASSTLGRRLFDFTLESENSMAPQRGSKGG